MNKNTKVEAELEILSDDLLDEVVGGRTLDPFATVKKPVAPILNPDLLKQLKDAFKNGRPVSWAA